MAPLEQLLVLHHRMSRGRKMAEQPKVHSSPSAFLHPLATVATAQTVGGGGGFIPLIQSLMSPKEETGHHRPNLDSPLTTSAPAAVDKIQAFHSDHCYPKINAFVPSLRNCGSLPTVTLFEDLKDEQAPSSVGEPTNPLTLHRSGPQTAGQGQEEEEEEEEIDIVSVSEETALPYDDGKVKTAMLECEKHVNMVKLISAKMEKRDLNEATPQQKALLLRVCEVLQADRLARLAVAEDIHEPVKRRLHTDKAAWMIRQAFADVQWDPAVVHWVNGVLLQSLDPILLPVYLDVLQVLKAKCGTLLEKMIRATVSRESSEALDFLLKRPWNPVVGIQSMDKQTKLMPQPCFIVVPHAPSPVGGRRMKMWQHQLSNIGKVHPVPLPSHLSELGHGTTPEACARYILVNTCSKVQELYSQAPERPIVLVTWSCGVRIACKVAEVLHVSCILALGPTTRGAEREWDLATDPIKNCKVPILLAAGTKSPICSLPYLKSLLPSIQPLNQLVIVNEGDELLRLQPSALMQLKMTQAMVDRCIQHEVYTFLARSLPVDFVSEEPKLPKKRKVSASQASHELSSTQLTPAPLCVSPIPIPLEPEAKKSTSATRSSASGKPNMHGAQTQYKTGSGGPQGKVGGTSTKAQKGTPVGKNVGKTVKKQAPAAGSGSGAQKSKSKGSPTLPCLPTSGNPLSPPSGARLPAIPVVGFSPSGSPSHLIHMTSSGPSALTLRPMPATPPRNPFASIGSSYSSQLYLAPGTLKQLNQQTDNQ